MMFVRVQSLMLGYSCYIMRLSLLLPPRDKQMRTLNWNHNGHIHWCGICKYYFNMCIMKFFQNVFDICFGISMDMQMFLLSLYMMRRVMFINCVCNLWNLLLCYVYESLYESHLLKLYRGHLLGHATAISWGLVWGKVSCIV